MSLEASIHELVLGMDGVAVVYTADPIWLMAMKQLGALLGPGGEAAPVPFVVCTEEAPDPAADGGSARAAMTVRVRIGTGASAPAPGVARAVAGAIRALVSAQRPELDVKAVVEVSAIGV